MIRPVVTSTHQVPFSCKYKGHLLFLNYTTFFLSFIYCSSFFSSGKCYQDIVINRPRKPGKKRKKKHTVQLLRIPSTPEGQKSILVEIAKYTAFPTSPVKQCDAVVDTRSLCVVGWVSTYFTWLWLLIEWSSPWS